MTSVAAVPQTGSIDRIVLEVPATTGHLRTVRLLVSALATAHGADLNDLEDLRIASGELCAHLIGGVPQGARMTVVAEVFAGLESDSPWLLLRAIVPDVPRLDPFDDISSMVLSASSDRFGVGVVPEFPESQVEGHPTRAEMGSAAAAWFRRHVRADRLGWATGD